MSDPESSNEETIVEEHDEDDSRLQIREKLSNMSFEDIQKLKEELGTKLYNETVFGSKTKNKKKGFKRENKNRPRERSSKIRVKMTNVIPVKKQTFRDPRFDSKCGEYDEKTFKSNYKFLNDVRKKDKKDLENELKDATDPERKKQIKFLIQRLNNQIQEEDKREQLHQQKISEKIEIREKKKRGEKPIYKNKSEKKIEDLIDKYEELKKSNKLQKHIEKRSKKLSIKERIRNRLLR